jgi:uncharacterized CHY-type Zn-finger protein
MLLFYIDLRRIIKMNETRLIDATALLNHIAVLEKEDEDYFDFYEEMKKIIRKFPTKYVTDSRNEDLSTWEIAPHETIPTKKFVCTSCRNEVETKHYTDECYYDFCPFCGSRKIRNI